MKRCIPLLCLLVLSSAMAQSVELTKVKSFEELSNTNVTFDWGKPTLNKKYFPKKLKHAESEHFIYHYDRNITKIARRAEECYNTIIEFLGNPEDKMGDKKSHIFIIPDWDTFKLWRLDIPQLDWIGGVCRGNEFYFSGKDWNGKFDSKGKLLNHEMTHLVFNRLFPKHVPTWLNEGVAEYFGARENMGTSEFRKFMGRKKGSWTLAELSKYERRYPEGDEAKASFYGEAAMFVDFLTTRHEAKQLVELIHFTMEGGKIEQAAVKIYKYDNLDAMQEKYDRYRRKF